MNPTHSQLERGKAISTTRLFRAMGTEAYIEIVHAKGETRRARASIAKAVDICFEKIKIFSRFDPESELSKLNRNIGTFKDASPDMIAVALHSIEFNKESKGLFDPRILSTLEHIGYASDASSKLTFASISKRFFPFHSPSLKHDLKIWGESLRFDTSMDFSGIAKGYILDKMAESIAKDGWKNFLVDAGGDMVVRGANREILPWRIDIENIPSTEILLTLSNISIATSGVTRRQWTSPAGKRYHHLINPKHPNVFSFDILSVTTLAETAERADFIAKTLFLMGIKDGYAYAKKHSVPALFVENKTMRPHISPVMRKYILTKNQ